MAIFIFGLISTLFLIIDAGTGGVPRLNNRDKVKYGSWKYVLVKLPQVHLDVDEYLNSPDALFPLYMISGISYGMVELIRRIIPRDIVGGDVHSMYNVSSSSTSQLIISIFLSLELRKMDALVHILYEVAGTCGALLSVKLIQIFGNNFSFLITPPLFAIAGLTWSFVDRLGHEGNKDADGKTNYLRSIMIGTKAFGRSTYKGALICFSHRRFIWLLPGYSLARMCHLFPLSCHYSNAPSSLRPSLSRKRPLTRDRQTRHARLFLFSENNFQSQLSV